MVNKMYNNYLNIFYSTLNFFHCVMKHTMHSERFSLTYYSIVTIPAVVIPFMGTFTFLMRGETSQQVTWLSLFFIFELLYVQFLDMKISNSDDHIIYLVLLYRNSFILITLAIVLSVISDELYKCSTEEFPYNTPEWIKTVLKFLLNKPRMTMLTNFYAKRSKLLAKKDTEHNTPKTQRNENALFWKTLSILLDCLAFIITLVLSLTNFFLLLP